MNLATLPWLEIAANAVIAVSIFLAGRNSIHTWWTGIIGCVLFGALFYTNQLYADTLLQVFFIGTSVYGWRHWQSGAGGTPAPVQRTSPALLAAAAAGAVFVALVYGSLLKYFTDAYAPFVDSGVLTFSVVAQFLLMARRYETWWFWLLVNTLSVGLFASRGLTITAVLYAVFWLNALWALWTWRTLLADPQQSNAR